MKMTPKMRIIFYLCILAVTFNVIEGQRKPNDQNRNTTDVINVDSSSSSPKIKSARQAWINLDQNLKSGIGKLIKRVMPMIMREVYQKNITTHCLNSLLQTSQALKKTKLWAFQMLDASGKLPDGFLRGGLSTLGNYEECVSIDVNETRLKLQGQYCTINVRPPLPEWKPFMSIYLGAPELLNISKPDTVINYLMSLIHNLHIINIKLGLCLPSTCSRDDIEQLLQIIPEKLGVDIKFDVSRCEVRKVTRFSATQKIILYALGGLLFLILCGTVVDRTLKVEPGQQKGIKDSIVQFLRCFSFFGNSRKLSQHVYPQENLRFINGLKFIMLLWIIIANTFMYINYQVASNFTEAFNILSNLFYEIVLNRIVAIQTFFFISGFITSYKCITSSEQRICIWKYILKRYWRYTPTYLLVIGVIMLTPLWGSGPSWSDNMSEYYSNCKANWWTNILYINNFVGTGSVCLDHTWMLAVDAQLHILGLFVLIPLKIRPKIGLMVNFVLIGASLMTVALTNVYYQIPPNEMAAFLHVKDRFFYAQHTYYRVYTHACVYCTGIAVGYLLAEKPKLQISGKISLLLWVTTVTGALATLCTIHEWRTGFLPAPLLAALYAALGKAAWAAFLSWITVACVTGRASTLNDFLGWRAFAFFGRLVFISYIVHPVIISMVFGYKKSHVYVQEFEILYTVLSHAAATYILAYTFHVCFEVPLLSITNIIRKKCGIRTLSVRRKDEKCAGDCNAVMTEKPITYEDKKKKEREAQQNINKTKC